MSSARLKLLDMWMDLQLSKETSAHHLKMGELPPEKKKKKQETNFCICSQYFRKIRAATQTRCKAKYLDVTQGNSSFPLNTDQHLIL